MRVYRAFIGFYIMIIFSSCASSKSFQTKHINFVYTNESEVHYDKWQDDDVVNHIGEFSIVNDGSSSLLEYTGGYYCVKARVSANGKEKDCVFCIDTGSQGNLLCKETAEYFEYGNPAEYKIRQNLFYAKSLNSNGNKTFYLNEIKTSGFKVKNMLMQETPLDYLGYLADGTPIDGIIGMILLSKAPFLFSVAKNELKFFDREYFSPNGTKIDFQSDALKKYELRTNIGLYKNIQVEGLLDTGYQMSYVNKKIFKKIKKNADVLVRRKEFLTNTYFYILKTCDFLGSSISSAPFQTSGVGLGDNTVTIGLGVLRYFDFYVDFKNECGYFLPQNEVSPISLCDVIFFGKIPFGFHIDNDDQKGWISSVYFVNGKPVYKEIKLFDSVISINGIPVQNVDWDWYSALDDADLMISHKGKTKNIHIVRHDFIK